jgi:DNA-binding transcriptional regulator YdaS (Cro superfamily)
VNIQENRVLRHFGGSRKDMAERLGVSESAVSQWFGAGFPPLRALQIEKESRGRVKALRLVNLNACTRETT